MADKKIRQCYLHIGSGKTGTTAIQTNFFRHRRHLRDISCFYPNNDANHIFMATRFREDPTEIAVHAKNGRESKGLIAEYIDQEMQQFEKDLSNFTGDTLFLSSEYFPPTSPEGCKKLAEYLHGFCAKVTVICYVRHPVSHAISAAQQSVKMGFSTLAERQNASFFFKPAKILPKFIDAFGRENIVVRPFDRKQLKDGNVVADFLSLTGLSDDKKLASLPDNESNSSLSYEAALIANALTKETPRTINGMWNPLRAKRVNLMKIPGARFGLGETATRRIIEASKPELAYLKNEFSLHFENLKNNITDDPKAAWDDEAIQGLSRKFNALALEAQHAKAQAFYFRSQVAELNSDKALAIKFLKEANNLAPLDWDITKQLYLLLVEAGSQKDAQGYLNRYSLLKPGDARTAELAKNADASIS